MVKSYFEALDKQLDENAKRTARKQKTGESVLLFAGIVIVGTAVLAAMVV